MTNFLLYTTILSKHYILIIYQAQVIQKSVQHDSADGHPGLFCRSHTEFSMLLITMKKAGRIRKDSILPNTKEENIIGGKEKTVSPDTVLKDYWSGNEEFADLLDRPSDAGHHGSAILW